MKAVIFGGGPLTDEIGNKLVNYGIRTWVRVYSGYGATEFGTISIIPPHDQPDTWPWNYIRFSPHVKAHFIPQNDRDNAFELVFEAGEDHDPFVLNSEINGKAVYRTRDLLIPHPSKSNLWKFVGRVDDQIILLNGEKTNPGPMETEIVKCPLVHGAVVFGQARNQTGVLVELKETSGLLSEMGTGKTKFTRPYIERANQTSSTHSRLDKQSIIFSDPARPLPRTPKGTIPRSAVLKLYARDIEEMYEALEQDLDTNPITELQLPEAWTNLEVVSDWIAKQVEGILGWNIDTMVDLFQQGLDSLTATMLLRGLKTSLHASQDPKVQNCAQTLDQAIIFQNPTVQQLALLLVQRITSPDALNGQVPTGLEHIHAMIRKYDWPQSQTNYRTRRPDMLREHIVVTGTTGALGSHLLAQLLANDRVERVWALNRKSSGGISTKQKASFEDKMLDVQLLASEKLVFVDAVLDDAKLGLSDELYDEVCAALVLIQIAHAIPIRFEPQRLSSFMLSCPLSIYRH
ncbi:acetyl-CoA synthetase-like protein, putative, partial [Rhizoctonia solani AG-3 Rhs1AP]